MFRTDSRFVLHRGFRQNARHDAAVMVEEPGVLGNGHDKAESRRSEENRYGAVRADDSHGRTGRAIATARNDGLNFVAACMANYLAL